MSKDGRETLSAGSALPMERFSEMCVVASCRWGFATGRPAGLSRAATAGDRVGEEESGAPAMAKPARTKVRQRRQAIGHLRRISNFNSWVDNSRLPCADPQNYLTLLNGWPGWGTQSGDQTRSWARMILAIMAMG